MNRRDCVPDHSRKVSKEEKGKQFSMKEEGFSREKPLVSLLSRPLWVLSGAVAGKYPCREIAVPVQWCRAVRSRTCRDIRSWRIVGPYKDRGNRPDWQYPNGGAKRYVQGHVETFAVGESPVPTRVAKTGKYRCRGIAVPVRVGRKFR